MIPGKKLAGYAKFFRENQEILSQYEQFALIDDDIDCSSIDLNDAFRLGRKYGLWLWQPTLTWNSYFSYLITLYNPLFEIRFVNFVEIMCPFFSADHLKLTLQLFDLNYELGIDRIWCRMRDNSRHKYAMLDSVRVTHTRPIGTTAPIDELTGKKVDYLVESHIVEKHFGAPFRRAVAYGGVLKKGALIDHRLAMFFLCVTYVLVAVTNEKYPKLYLVKHFMGLLLRLCTSPLDNDRLPYFDNIP